MHHPEKHPPIIQRIPPSLGFNHPENPPLSSRKTPPYHPENPPLKLLYHPEKHPLVFPARLKTHTQSSRNIAKIFP
jgi:hypothetical protein